MTLANASRTQIAMAEETGGWAVTPSVAFNAVRYTSDDLVNEITKVTSEEVRSDQNIPSVVKVAEMATGGYSFELSYSTVQDLIFEGALTSDFSGAVNFVNIPNLAFAAADNSITDPALGLNVNLHQWVKISGATNAANNGYAQVISISGNGNKAIFRGPTFVDETTSGSTIFSSGTMKNGTAEKSYVVEKAFLDITKYFLFRGLKVNTFSLEIPTAEKITGSVSFMGQQGIAGNATSSTGAYVAAATSPITTSSVSVVSLFEDYSPATLEIQSMNLSVDRGLEANQAVANIYPIEINRGDCAVTGSMSIYFEDDSYFTKAKNNTSIALTLAIQDENGNAYLITLPNIKLMNFPNTIGGKNQPIIVPMDFQAILDPVTSCSIQVDKFSA